MLRNTLAAIRTAIAAPLFFIYTILISAIFVIVMTLRLRKAGEFFVQLWSRVFLWVPPLSYNVSGTENVQPGVQYFFLANHLSNFDIPLLFRAIPTPIRYLAKKELYRIPVFAQALHVAGIVKIDRGAGATSYAAINKGVARAKQAGYSLIVFAEGTRSRDGELHPFKKGAFRMAIATGLPVVPVTVSGTWEAWQPGAKIFYGGHAEVVIHEPIPTADLTVRDIDALRTQVYDIIDEKFHELHQS